MKRAITGVAAAALVAAGMCMAASQEVARLGQPLELVRASLFGTAGNDDIQGACAAADGGIYIAGNTGDSMSELPGGVAPVRIGAASTAPRCGHGFVAKLSADGGKILAYAEFGAGIAIVTTVQANSNVVYVAGYATDALEPVLKDVPGLIREYPLRKEVKLLEEGKWIEAVGEDTAKPDPIPESRNRQLGRYGAPFVIKMDAGLKAVQSGTYLEGWQQVWAKARAVQGKPEFVTWPVEHSWTPTLVGILKSGDVVVCHDGGYFRLLTDEDRALVAKTVPRMAHRLGFYDVCDHLSRLTQTLEERKYHVPIYTPATDVEVAKRIKDGWEKPHFSNPRTTRMRLDKDENIYLSGWSATATSKESWWSPFIWKLNPADGTIIRKIVETDPMSGGDNRMGGAVADRAIGSLAVDTNRLYYNSLSDGGWSGVIHFSGTIFKLDSAAGKETAKARTGPCYWCVDMAALPGDRLLALGRCNKVRDWPEKAWQKADGGQNPEAWLSLYNGAMQPEFTTAIRGVLPHSLCELGDGRYMVVGQSKGSLQKIVPKENKSVEVLEEPNPSVALLKDPLMDKPRGDDGYFMIVRDAAGR